MNTLKSVEIHNIMKVESFRFNTSAVTVISGGNDVGKSSILEAIRNVFHGGHDPEIIRQGAEKGIITLTLDDDSFIRKTITQKGYTLIAKTAKGALIRPPKQYIDKLAAGFAFDPIAMMDAKPEKRLQFLLDVMPIEFSAEELAEVLGDRAPVEACNLKKLEDIHAGIKEERTTLNRAVRDLAGSIQTVSDGLPAIDDEKDWAAEEKRLAGELTDQEWQLAADEKDMAAKTFAEKTVKREDAQAQIDAIRVKLADDEKLIDETAATLLEETSTAFRQQISNTATNLAIAQEKATAIERASGARKLLETQRDQMKVKFFEAEALSDKLKALDKLKKSKLSNLPIPGLDIRGGDIFIGGVPWGKENTSDLWLLVIQIGALATGKLPLLICDRAETLEDARWGEFREAIGKSGLQVITARVTEGALRVDSADAPEAAVTETK